MATPCTTKRKTLALDTEASSEIMVFIFNQVIQLHQSSPPMDLTALMRQHRDPDRDLVHQIQVDTSKSWVSETGIRFSVRLLIGTRPWAQVEQHGDEIQHDWVVIPDGMDWNKLVQQRSLVETWLQRAIDEIVTADALVGALVNCLVRLEEPTAPQALPQLRDSVEEALEYANDDDEEIARTDSDRKTYAQLERHRWRCIDCGWGTDDEIPHCPIAETIHPNSR